MSLKITPIRAFNDNYIWILINTSNKQAIVVDPGQAEPVFEYLTKHDLELTAIWITHHHYDHTGGVAQLRESFPMTHVVSHFEHEVNEDQTVKEGGSVNAWGYTAQIWEVPGHTAHHIAYILDKESEKHVFCGDTLFSAGCGRVFSGTMSELFDSLQRFNTLPENSLFYPAHEYTAANLRFGSSIEPDNLDIKQSLQDVTALVAAGEASLPVTLQHEQAVNVFLRVEEPSVIAGIQTHTSLPDTKPLTVFTALRQLKDQF